MSCESAKMRLWSILCASGVTVKPKAELLRLHRPQDMTLHGIRRVSEMKMKHVRTGL